MTTFGDNLKQARLAKGLSQRDFARKMGTTQQRVSEWECNKVEPTLYNLVAMLQILEIRFEDLIHGLYD